MNQTPLSTSYTDSTSSILSKGAYTQSASNSALSKISTGAQTLPEGSRLSARVMDFLGRDLTLKLPDGTVLHANSSTAVPLSIGQSAEFEVLRSTGEQLLLKLVSETPEEASTSLAGRALSAAGLPANEGNINLVNLLLANRMPVNAENLQALVRESNMFPGASPETLVMMHKHEMPVNSSTISQFQAYAGYEHEVMPQLSSLFESLSSPEFAKALADGMTGSTDSASGTDAANFPAAQTLEAQSAGTPELPSEIPSGSTSAVNGLVSGLQPESDVQNTETSTGSSSPVIDRSDSDTAVGALTNRTENTVEAKPDSPEPPASQDSTLQITKDGFIDAASGKPISFEERWTLTPEQLQKPGELEKVYERLHKDLTVLESAIKKAREKNPDEDSPLGKMLSQAAETAKKLLDNLDFMNVLNRYFPYIQLPMRMEEKFTNGELYVYTKKGGGKKDGEAASVLLHLDMESIGATDFFLSLSGTALKTKFYLADSDIEKLFTDHISELTERIEKLGLSCSYEFLPQKEAEQPVHDFLTSPEAVSMKRYRFDRRA